LFFVYWYVAYALCNIYVEVYSSVMCFVTTNGTV
jgi:hypothetical protein